MNLFLLVAALLQIVWGVVPTASKIVIDECPVELYIALRWTISSLIIWAIVFTTKSRFKVLKRDTLSVAGLGVLGYGIGSLGTLYGLKIGGVANFGLMAAVSPIIVTLASILFLKEKPRKLFYVALPLSIFAISLLIMGKYQVAGWKVASSAAALVIAAYIVEAIVFVCSKRFRSSFTTFQYMAISQSSAALLMWILQLFVFHQGHHIFALSSKAWLAALFVSVVACVLCYAILYWLLNHIDGHRLALFDGLHTVSAATFGYLIFNETISPGMIAGGVLLLLSITIGNWSSSAKS